MLAADIPAKESFVRFDVSNTPDDNLAALLVLMASPSSPGTLTPDDIPDEPSSVYNHSPQVSIAFDKPNSVVTVTSRIVAASSLPEGMVRWRTDFEEDRARVTFEKAEDKRKRKANKLRKLKERDDAREASKPLQQRFEAAAKVKDWSAFTPAEMDQMQTAGWIKQVRQEVEIVQAKPIPQKTVNFLDRMADQKERVRERRKFFHFGGGMIADRHYGEIYESFGEGKFRTSQHPFLARVNKLFARASSGRAQSGRNKREVTTHTKSESSLLIRDAAYIVGDPRRLGILVAELDSTWQDYNSLIMALRGALPKKLMPAGVVSRPSLCGNYQAEKPHLLWALPCEVGRNGKSRLAPQRFFRRVQRAIINALIPLGADPGHLNTEKFKNPLSPFWNVLCLNGDWPSLEDFRGKGGIDLNVNEAAMKQKAKLYRATKPGESLSLSNDIWNTGRDLIKASQSAAAAMQDPDYLRSRKDEHWRRCWLRSQITRPMTDKFGHSEQVHRVIDRHCDWWAKHRDKDDVDFGRDAARIMAEEQKLGRALSEQERQKMAATGTHEAQSNESLHTVAGVIVEARRAGYEPTPTEVITTCKSLHSVGKSTVYKYWDAAVLLADQIFRAGTRYIAIPLSGTSNEPDLPSSQQGNNVQKPVQPSGPPESGNIDRPPPSLWPLPTVCGPPVSTDDSETDFDDAGAMPVTAEACSRPRTTFH